MTQRDATSAARPADDTTMDESKQASVPDPGPELPGTEDLRKAVSRAASASSRAGRPFARTRSGG